MPEIPATIQDMGVSGLGLLADRPLPAGAPVRIESHGITAVGVVRHCRPTGGVFHLGIALHSLPAEP